MSAPCAALCAALLILPLKDKVMIDGCCPCCSVATQGDRFEERPGVKRLEARVLPNSTQPDLSLCLKFKVLQCVLGCNAGCIMAQQSRDTLPEASYRRVALSAALLNLCQYYIPVLASAREGELPQVFVKARPQEAPLAAQGGTRKPGPAGPLDIRNALRRLKARPVEFTQVVRLVVDWWCQVLSLPACPRSPASHWPAHSQLFDQKEKGVGSVEVAVQSLPCAKM